MPQCKRVTGGAECVVSVVSISARVLSGPPHPSSSCGEQSCMPPIPQPRPHHTHVDGRSHNAHSLPLMSTVPSFSCPACAGIIKHASSVGSATWSLSRLTRFLSSTMHPSARSAHPPVRSAGNQSQHTTSSSRANTSVRGSSLDLLALRAHSLHSVAHFHLCVLSRRKRNVATHPFTRTQKYECCVRSQPCTECPLGP
jgi:hypothetical protein